jgi:hypothetical protein
MRNIDGDPLAGSATVVDKERLPAGTAVSPKWVRHKSYSPDVAPNLRVVT